jgi:hypothetical protein
LLDLAKPHPDVGALKGRGPPGISPADSASFALHTPSPIRQSKRFTIHSTGSAVLLSISNDMIGYF